MATLDISSALNAMVQASTPQAQMERNLALGMFSSKISEVSTQAKKELLEIGKVTKQLLEDDDIDPDIAALLIESCKNSLEIRTRFESSYFG